MEAQSPAFRAADLRWRIFMELYYNSIVQCKEKPWLVSCYYTDASSMKRVDGDNVESALGLEQISNLLNSQNLLKAEIKTAHSMDSICGAVLVIISGFLQKSDSLEKKKFSHTVFLTPHKSEYLVVNDMLHLLEVSMSQETELNQFGPVTTVVKYTADVVGQGVVTTYYRYIIDNKEKPSCMSHCYRDESLIMRIDGAKVETASGLEEIEKFVMFPNVSKIEIKGFKATHFIDLMEGGVLVMVKGLLHTTDNVAGRNFIQIFFFSSEYYIINDVLQFIEEEHHMNQVLEGILPQMAALEFFIPLLAAENVTDIPQDQQTCAECSDRRVEETLMETVGENPNPIDQPAAPNPIDQPAAQEPVTYASIVKYGRRRPGRSRLHRGRRLNRYQARRE